MPATRSTTKPQRKTQNSRQNAVQQGRHNFYRCQRCGNLFSNYHNSHTRHERVCKKREEEQKLNEERIQAEWRTPTPQPYTPAASSPEIGSELEARIDITEDMDMGACFL